MGLSTSLEKVGVIYARAMYMFDETTLASNKNFHLIKLFLTQHIFYIFRAYIIQLFLIVTNHLALLLFFHLLLPVLPRAQTRYPNDGWLGRLIESPYIFTLRIPGSTSGLHKAAHPDST